MGSQPQFAGVALREPIAASWRRASLAGLKPATALRGHAPLIIDPRSSLLTAAVPVLDELTERLRGTGMLTILVDHTGRIVYQRGDREVVDTSDALGLRVGALLAEDAVGTNGPGTALEARSRVVVHGREHFAEDLRRFSCCGQPIFHPATRRLQGALNISVLGPQANPLVAPLIAKAVVEIEQLLLDRGRTADRILLAAFQSTARRTRPVVAIGGDLLLSNQAAVDLLDSTDVTRLRHLTGEVAGLAELDFELRSGAWARARVERISGARGGVLVHLQLVGGEPARTAPVHTPTLGHLHITGPTGSGRSTEAAARVPQGPVLTGAQALLDGSAAWAERFGAALRGDATAVGVDGVDLLPAELVDLVAAHAAARRAPNLVLTSGPWETLSGPVRALVARCDDTVELLPLASRLTELPDIAARMLDELGSPAGHHLTPGALRTLGGYDWPGNLTELRAVLEHAVRKRGAGAIMPDDLPPALAAGIPDRELAPIEHAERNAIVAALREAAGNKVQAARSLGISRTTLYARIRALKVRDG